MNRPYEREPSDKWGLLVALVSAAAIVAGGLYIVLKKAAPVAAMSVTARIPEPTQTALPAASPKTPSVDFNASAQIDELSSQGPTVYRCTVNGHAIYSDTPCPGGKVIDARPASSGFVAERPRSTVRGTQAPSSQPLSLPSVASTSATEKATREARCAWIEAEIERIDALARQGRSAASQDWLRETRHKLLDEKYTVKC